MTFWSFFERIFLWSLLLHHKNTNQHWLEHQVLQWLEGLSAKSEHYIPELISASQAAPHGRRCATPAPLLIRQVDFSTVDSTTGHLILSVPAYRSAEEVQHHGQGLDPMRAAGFSPDLEAQWLSGPWTALDTSAWFTIILPTIRQEQVLKHVTKYSKTIQNYSTNCSSSKSASPCLAVLKVMWRKKWKRGVERWMEE